MGGSLRHYTKSLHYITLNRECTNGRAAVASKVERHHSWNIERSSGVPDAQDTAMPKVSERGPRRPRGPIRRN